MALSEQGRHWSQACHQPRHWRRAVDSAEPPCAAAATSLLNYINRPPSSVIFYYTGKNKTGWAGKNLYFHLVNTGKWVTHRSRCETFLWRMLGSPLSGQNPSNLVKKEISTEVQETDPRRPKENTTQICACTRWGAEFACSLTSILAFLWVVIPTW